MSTQRSNKVKPRISRRLYELNWRDAVGTTPRAPNFYAYHLHLQIHTKLYDNWRDVECAAGAYQRLLELDELRVPNRQFNLFDDSSKEVPAHA